MDILEQIVAKKRKEIKERKAIIDESFLRFLSHDFDRKCYSLKENLLAPDATGIIAEFKKKSPSKGWINKDASVALTVIGYKVGGASGVSILTDEEFFGGEIEDLGAARAIDEIPLLRKDFMLDEIQILEAKAYGADVILLIAACLDPKEVKTLAAFAKNLGLEVLLEIHNEKELGHICDEVDMVGVNNRNLKTFEVDINNALQLINKIPTSKPAIAESGISDAETIVTLRKAGFKGFLIGETFMKQADPAIAFAQFVQQLKAKANE